MSDCPTLAAALVEALADLTVVETARTANIPTKDGKSYSYKYADIGDVVNLTRPVLAEHGLVALTPVHDHGDGLACTVTILHTSGERLDLGPFPFPHGRDAQTTGSMVTYHRRYALVAALGMAAGDDDDGAKASTNGQRKREPEPLTERAAYNEFIELLKAGGLDDHVAEAERMWLALKVQVVDGVVSQDEWQRILDAANERMGATA